MSSDKIDFYETLREDGSLEVSWQASTSRDWKRILKLVKGAIKPGERAYNSETKKWIISSSCIPIYEDIKQIVLNDDNEKLDAIDSQIEDETVARIVNHNLMELPKTMREKAIYAIQATLGIIETEVEFSVSEGLFGAWNENHGHWFYENGRYSSISPSERDKRTVDSAFERLRKSYERISEAIESLDSETQESWKRKFRAQMLEKYDYRCYTCHERPEKLRNLHMHRVQPGREGGVYVEDNVVILCVGCHRAYEGNSWEFFNNLHSIRW